MQTIHSNHTDSTGTTELLFDSINGGRPATNMIRTIAQSQPALEAYLRFREALGTGTLLPEMREQIALTVAQTNLCEYSLAEHAWLAGQLGMTREQIQASREARSRDKKTSAALRFAHSLITRERDWTIDGLRESGHTNADVMELIACVTLNLFENYVAELSKIEIDFPKFDAHAKTA